MHQWPTNPKQKNWIKAVVVTSLDWPFILSPGAACQTGEPPRLSSWHWPGSLLLWCHHMFSLFLSGGANQTWWGGIGSQPRMKKLSSLLFLSFTPDPLLLFGHALRTAVRIPEFSDSLLVFRLAVRQENRRAFSKSRWVWGRSPIFSNILPPCKLNQWEIPLERACKCSQGFQIKVPIRHPTR